MKINALLMNEKDNVATCVADIAAGEDVVFRKGDDYVTLKALEPIAYCHKIALATRLLSKTSLVAQTSLNMAKVSASRQKM